MLAERELGGKQLGGMQPAQLARAKMLDLGHTQRRLACRILCGLAQQRTGRLQAAV